MSAYDDNITGNANCVAYWTLDGTVNDSIGTNHLSGGTAGTYVEGPFGYDQGMLFNGTTQSISSASAIDLTGTNKTTFTMFWCPTSYDMANAEWIVEFSTSTDSLTDGFMFLTNGALANDPLKVYLKGDVGVTVSDYYPSTFGFNVPKWMHIAAVYDKSLSSGETSLYINGKLATVNTISNSNNTNAFGNHSFFIGARNNSTGFSNGIISKIALFDTALTAEQIGKIYSLGVNARKSYLKLDSSLKLRD